MLISLLILYKGEKSYYTYYGFLSKIPDNFTEIYLKSSIKQSNVEEAIKLLRRQKKIIYSNANEVMISDLLINTYSAYSIVNTKKTNDNQTGLFAGRLCDHLISWKPHSCISVVM